MDEYVLRGGKLAAERLRVLARVQWPYTRTLLCFAGLHQGSRCLDLGCGIGGVTLGMARVVGIDPDEQCPAVGRAAAKRAGLPAEFRSGSVATLAE